MGESMIGKTFSIGIGEREGEFSSHISEARCGAPMFMGGPRLDNG